MKTTTFETTATRNRSFKAKITWLRNMACVDAMLAMSSREHGMLDVASAYQQSSAKHYARARELMEIEA